jgi:hypothetical protein
MLTKTKLSRQQTKNTSHLLTKKDNDQICQSSRTRSWCCCESKQRRRSSWLDVRQRERYKSLDKPSIRYMLNNNIDIDEFNYQEAVDVFAPSDLQDTENENERDLSSSIGCVGCPVLVDKKVPDTVRSAS